MNHLNFALVLVLTCLLFTTCTKESFPSLVLEVKYDEWTDGPGLRVMLTDEISDSRCPQPVVDEVNCVWQGEATGMLATEIENVVHHVPYRIEGLCNSVDDPCGNSIDTLGYSFQFIYLAPYPEGSNVPDEYTLTVKIEQN